MESKLNKYIYPIKELKKEILINGGDLDLYLDVSITDKYGKTENILSKKADSILANFVRMMYLMMGRDNRDNIMGTFYKVGHVFTGASITSLSAGTGGVVRINISSSQFSSYPSSGLITLGGFQGISLDGRYTFNKINSSAIDILGTTYSAGWTAGTGGGTAYFPITKMGNPYYYTFQNIGIIIGTGNTPVNIDDQLLEKEIPNSSANGGLTYGSNIVSQDTNDSVSSQITITRTFTNNGSLTIPTREIGLLMRAGTDDVYMLVMRDVFPSVINVSQGSTLTVNYRLKTVLGTGTDAGGFVSNFMRLMYRHIGQTPRAIFDIDNVSRTYYPSNSSFNCLYAGGMNKTNPNEGENFSGYKFGIVVGMGTTPVSMGDYYLETPITHGNGTNQMLYYGGFAEDFTIGANYAEFSIFKAIENNSGASININEYGLVVVSDTNTGLSSISNNYNSLIMISRNVLSSPIVVNNQQILKVSYTFRVVVSGSSS